MNSSLKDLKMYANLFDKSDLTQNHPTPDHIDIFDIESHRAQDVLYSDTFGDDVLQGGGMGCYSYLARRNGSGKSINMSAMLFSDRNGNGHSAQIHWEDDPAPFPPPYWISFGEGC